MKSATQITILARMLPYRFETQDRRSGQRSRPSQRAKPASRTRSRSSKCHVRDGFRAAGTLTIIGRNARSKRVASALFVLQRVLGAGFTL